MIIDCIYNTHADVGIFSSDAKFNTETGIVFDIETCDDEDAENINSVHRETVFFNFNNEVYEFTVSYNDDIGEYQIEDISLFNSINLFEKLDNQIPHKEIKSSKKI